MKPLFLVIALAAACASTPQHSDTVADQPQELTAAERAKIDRALRAQIKAEPDARVPVRVVFESEPSEDALLDLLLVKQGNRYVGQVPVHTVEELARRSDVTRIYLIEGAGYSEV